MKPVDRRLIGKDGILMSDMMPFPDTWEEFEKLYGFNDAEEIYTNNSRLIPSFRVKQWLDHLPSVQPRKGKWIYGEHDIAMCDGYRCDKCGFFVPWDYQHKFIDFINEYNFCPNCGSYNGGEDDVPESIT